MPLLFLSQGQAALNSYHSSDEREISPSRKLPCLTVMVPGDWATDHDFQTHLKIRAMPGQILFPPSLKFGGFENLHCSETLVMLCFKIIRLALFSFTQSQVRKIIFCDNSEWGTKNKETSRKDKTYFHGCEFQRILIWESWLGGVLCLWGSRVVLMNPL